MVRRWLKDNNCAVWGQTMCVGNDGVGIRSQAVTR